jgi:hypothetical protein
MFSFILLKTIANGGCSPGNTGIGTQSVTTSAAGQKNGVINRAFAELQEKQTVRVKTDVVSMDSISVKIHSDTAGAHEKTELSPSVFPATTETPEFIWLPRMIE